MSLLQTLGWSFVHFLWQGGVIALACWALLTLARSATLRYAIGCVGLFVMLAAPVATFFQLFDSSADAVVISNDSIPIRSVEPLAIYSPPSLITPNESVPAQNDWNAVGTALVPWLGRAWIAGILVIALWHAAGYVQLSRLRRRSASLDDFEWIARLRHWKDRLSIRRSVSLLVTERIDCPAVVGFLRPAILWPAAALTGLTPTQIDALLAHELAHIRRYDDVMNLVQVGIETVLFFHPCVWWLSRRIRQERENCCDDLAATVLGSRAKYADALVAMESLRQMNSLSLQANGGSLMKRIQRLLEPNMSAPRTRSAHGITILIAIACAVSIWGGHTNAADAEATTKPTEPLSTQAIHDGLKSAISGLLSARDEQRAKAQTLSQFSPEAIELQNRSRETMKRFVQQIFEIVATSSWKEQLETAIRVLEEDERTGAAQRLSKDDFFELLRGTLREAEVQLGKESVVAVRLAEFLRASDEVEQATARRFLAGRDPFFDRLVAERDHAEAELAKLRLTVGKNAPTVVKLSAQIELLDDRIQEMAKAMAQQSESEQAVAHSDHDARIAESKKLEAKLKELEAQSKQIAEAQQKQIESANQQSRLAELRSLNKERDSIVAAIEAKKVAPDTEEAEVDQLRGLLTQVNNQLDALSGAIGEYYVGGHVTRPGVYSLTARKISLKQAMIAAVAAEMKDESLIQLVRRDPITRKESIKTVKWSDIRSSAVGDEGGDFYLLPDDQIMVGTKPPATQPATQPAR